MLTKTGLAALRFRGRFVTRQNPAELVALRFQFTKQPGVVQSAGKFQGLLGLMDGFRV
jgi:hypothetical protein